jgi:drug/metabolite transporter (DMT)-like permease
LVFALLPFGGVALVLLSAPPGGDASVEGNVFGVLAMLLLVVGYVSSTRYFQREMDVTTFMATICPIATVAVLPVAVGRARAVTSIMGMADYLRAFEVVVLRV